MMQLPKIIGSAQILSRSWICPKKERTDLNNIFFGEKVCEPMKKHSCVCAILCTQYKVLIRITPMILEKQLYYSGFKGPKEKRGIICG